MNRSSITRRLRYADGGPVGAGIGSGALVDFVQPVSQMPIPMAELDPLYRQQFALSNYDDPYISETAVPPPVVPSEEDRENAVKALTNKLQRLNDQYAYWQGSFQLKEAPPLLSARANSSSPEFREAEAARNAYKLDPYISSSSSISSWREFNKQLKDYEDEIKKYQSIYKENESFVPQKWASTNPYNETLYMKAMGIPIDDEFYNYYYADGGEVSMPNGSVDPTMANVAFDNGRVQYSEADMQEITNTVISAIEGDMPNGEEIIQQFISIFGEEAFREILSMVQGGQGGNEQGAGPFEMGAASGGGHVVGAGGPRSDSIPAVVNGQIPARLSDGEYVIPADAVAGIGNGSRETGVEQLNKLVVDARNRIGIGGV